jgi:hypothetical protein
MSVNTTVEKIIADNVELINFANFLQGQGLQNDFTNFQTAVAKLGFVFPGLSSGVVESMIAKYGANAVTVLTTWNQCLIDFVKFNDPSYVAPVPAFIAPAAPAGPIA